MKNNDFVTASEIGEYVFCKRAWWLKRNNFTKETSQMVAGTRAHNFIARNLEQTHMVKNIAFILIFIGLILVGLLFFLIYK